jgi:ATP-dependent protease HslVU (ClpYQ) peptidase subunit
MASEEIKKAMRKVEAKFTQKGDQELQEFRALYADWDGETRGKFREALMLVADGNEILRKLPNSMLGCKVETSWQVCDNEGEVVAGGSGRLSARLLLQAIEAWDKGEDFAPGGMAFIH